MKIRVAALLATLAAMPAAGQNLVIGTGSPPLSADPHFFNGPADNALSASIYNRLVERDAMLRLQPSLAVRWGAVSSTAWDVHLRPDVRWSDGRPFGAEDVAFTLQRARNVPNSPGGFGTTLRAVARVEVVDPLLVRIHTNQPQATLPNDLSYISILPAHRAAGVTTEELNAARMTVTTAPYRLERFVPNERVDLIRNPDHFGPAEPWSQVSIRIIRSPASRVAALLSGDVEAIDLVPSVDLPRLKGDARLRVTESAGVRTVYLAPNLAAEVPEPPLLASTGGEPLAANPLRDRRVRQALSLALARDQLAERVMEGAADPTFQFMPAGAYTFDAALGVPRQDVAEARRLLAAAGYPNGFRLTLLAPNGSPIPNDARLAQAIAQQWTRIGVQVAVEALPQTAFAPRQARSAFGVTMGSWGATYGSVVSPFASVVGSRDAAAGTGSFNFSRYSNPAVDALVRRSAAELDDARREAILLEGVRLVAEDVGVLPLFTLRNAWATRRGLVHQARADGWMMPTAIRAAP
jgi:peptide/nickel transport system substrate-binding protein